MSVGGARFEHCPGCRGRWIDWGTFLAMWAEMAQAAPPELHPRDDGARERRCPVCSDAMARVELLVIPLDHCQRHGVWFDRRELETSLAASAISLEDWFVTFGDQLTRMA